MNDGKYVTSRQRQRAPGKRVHREEYSKLKLERGESRKHACVSG